MSIHRSHYRLLAVEPLEDRLLLSLAVAAPAPSFTPPDPTPPVSSIAEQSEQYYPDQSDQASMPKVVSPPLTQNTVGRTLLPLPGQSPSPILLKYIEEQEYRQGRSEGELGKSYRPETLKQQERSLGVEASRLLAGGDLPRASDHGGQPIESTSSPPRNGAETLAPSLRGNLEATALMRSAASAQPASRLFALRMGPGEDERLDTAPIAVTKQDAVQVEEEQETRPSVSERREAVVEVAPEPGVPLAGLLPLDLKLLQQNVDAFFTQLSQLAEDNPPAGLCLKMIPWLGITVMAAWEIALLARKKKAEELNPECAIHGSLAAALGNDT
jgi:hypothetical protein